MRRRSAMLALLVLALPGAAAGQAEDAGERERLEEELFGPPDEAEAPEAAEAPPEAGSPAEAGDEAPEAELFARRLDDLSARLELGGLLYLRLDGAFDDETPLSDAPLRSPSLFDLYADARPNDRVRAFARGRLVYDFTVAEGDTGMFGAPAETTRVLLDQLWLRFDAARRVYFTVGRQPVRWGAGRFWNPTDFLNRTFRDPLAVIDERLGVTLIKVHVPVESRGWNFYAVGHLEDADALGEVGAALRAELLFGTTELAATVATRREAPTSLGLGVSSGVGRFDLRGELAVLHGVRTPRWEGELDLDPARPRQPTAVDRSDDWLVRAVVGGEVGLRVFEDDAIYLGAEYFFNALGQDGAGLYPWLVVQGQLEPFYLGRHYGALYAALPAPGRWDDTTFSLAVLGNLSDRSYVGRLDGRVRVLRHLAVNGYGALHFGDRGEFRFGLELPPGLPGLPDGLTVVPPRLELGVGLAVDL